MNQPQTHTLYSIVSLTIQIIDASFQIPWWTPLFWDYINIYARAVSIQLSCAHSPGWLAIQIYRLDLYRVLLLLLLLLLFYILYVVYTLYGYSVACVAVGEKETHRRVQPSAADESSLSLLYLSLQAQKLKKQQSQNRQSSAALPRSAALSCPFHIYKSSDKSYPTHPTIEKVNVETCIPKLHIKSYVFNIDIKRLFKI